jgi:hypothetical protein
MLRLLAVLLCFQSVTAQAVEFRVRVLSYNIQGLPWPLIKDQGQFDRIGEILAEQRAQGTAPHIVLIQEGFRYETRALIERSGYPYVYRGPIALDLAPGDRFHGTPKILNGGLWILSQFPFEKTAKVPFLLSSCAGDDCYANKGVAMVRVRIPGVPVPVEFFTLHMNAKGATAGVPQEVVDAVQLKQLHESRKFIDQTSDPALPAIFAGDFNLRPEFKGFAFLSPIIGMTNAGEICVHGECTIDPETNPLMLVEKSVDQHLFRSGSSVHVAPVHAARTFTEKLPNGRPLSDHLGYEIEYRLNW